MKLIRVVLTLLMVAALPGTLAAKEAQTLKELVQQYDASSCKE